MYKYNRQIYPPAPLISVIVRSTKDAGLYVATPALTDYGADFSVITEEIFEALMPVCVGDAYVEGFIGEGETLRLYAVGVEFHGWHFPRVPVFVDSKNYIILGRDLLNKFDIRLNGIEGKLEILRGPT
ncbi:MAG: hypothetical protein AAB354_14880 [candidate division KSB1 bacterium]